MVAVGLEVVGYAEARDPGPLKHGLEPLAEPPGKAAFLGGNDASDVPGLISWPLPGATESGGGATLSGSRPLG